MQSERYEGSGPALCIYLGFSVKLLVDQPRQGALLALWAKPLAPPMDLRPLSLRDSAVPGRPQSALLATPDISGSVPDLPEPVPVLSGSVLPGSSVDEQEKGWASPIDCFSPLAGATDRSLAALMTTGAHCRTDRATNGGHTNSALRLQKTVMVPGKP